MELVVIDDGNVVKRYANEEEFRKANPRVAFPAVLTQEVFEEYGVYPLAGEPKPQHDPATQDVVEVAPVLKGQEWTRQFEVREAPPEEVERRRAERVPKVAPRAGLKFVLMQSGDWDDVIRYVDGLTDPGRQARAEAILDDAPAWVLDSWFVVGLAKALGRDTRSMEDLFTQAAEVDLFTLPPEEDPKSPEIGGEVRP